MDWDFILEILPRIADGLVVTVELTLLGTAIAMVLGLVLALLRRSRFRAVRWPASFAREFITNTPLLVQAFFFFYVFPEFIGLRLSPFLSGVIVIGIHYATYTSEVYRAGIEAVPAGQWQAARALNFSAGDTWRQIILPQAIPPIFPALGNYLISMFKDTPQLLAIGVLEMVGVSQAIATETYRSTWPYLIAGIFFVILSYIASLAVRRLEARFGRLA